MTAREERVGGRESHFAEAAGWYVRIREAENDAMEFSPEEIQAWERFYADPKNRAALDMAVRISDYVGHLTLPSASVAENAGDDEYDGSISVAEWLRRPRPAVRRLQRDHRLRRWVSIASLAAAACALLLVIARVGTSPWRGVTAAGPELIRTATGEQRVIVLSDGSEITVGARTELSVEYTSRERTVHLEQGEALFKVAHNAGRPFVVRAGSGTITAVGTQFDVRRDLDRVQVTVTDGTVIVAPVKVDGLSVSSLPAVHWDPLRLGQGHAVTYDATRRPGSVESADPAATDWTSGRLQYRDVPLKYVVADINRYRERQIVLGDAAAGTYEFTGTVFPDRIGEWAQSLERIFPITVRRDQRDGSHLIIQSRSSGTSRATAPPSRATHD